MHIEFHSQPSGFFHCMFGKFHPLTAKIIYGSFGYTRSYVETLYSSNTYAVHCFKVERNTLFGYISVHPMPPCKRPGRSGWVFEAVVQSSWWYIVHSMNDR